MGKEAIQSDIVQLQDDADRGAHISVLAVGDPDEWLRQGHTLPQQNLAFVSFQDVTEETLAHFNPTVIVSPVLANGFDCIELTLLLRNLGYTGAYRAVAQNLPKPALIEREVSQLYPSLNFKIQPHS